MLKSVAFPAVSWGAYGYPIRDACRIALTPAVEYLKTHPEIREARFVLFSEDDLAVYRETLESLPA